MFRRYFKLDIEVNNVENQVQLAEVDLELKNCVGLARHLDKELIFQELRYLWI